MHTRLLARFAGSLAGTCSRAGFVRLVTELPRRVLDVPAVGVLLVDHDGMVVTGGAPDGERFAGLFARQARSGPVSECYRAGSPVVLSYEGALEQGLADLAAEMSRAEVTAVDAAPLRVHQVTIGALAVYLDATPTPSYRRLSQLVQVVAGLGLTAYELRHDLCSATDTIEELAAAIAQRAAIEQATGVMAERWQVTIGDAASMLRECAQARRVPLHELAAQVVAGRNDLFD
ncbi:GAF and ANTAR domain-containing protein [Kutzneria sp. CA-103260]|uniref:GAF and ANTAR domain-containing protein n=1 Tax=Kutzneria sp. CA-103260 TaxID=2802641 RepID=UPI0020119382|nr:GAF and ANTAR domain-containing protein [Kutzneria sp. CA-103260]